MLDPQITTVLFDLDGTLLPMELEQFTNTYFGLLANKAAPTYIYDGSLVMGNLMLAASGIGLGSCWINRAKETFETPEGKALLAKWGLDPEKYIGVGYCILGYPAPNGTRTPGPRKAGYVLHV